MISAKAIALLYRVTVIVSQTSKNIHSSGATTEPATWKLHLRIAIRSGLKSAMAEPVCPCMERRITITVQSPIKALDPSESGVMSGRSRQIGCPQRPTGKGPQ